MNSFFQKIEQIPKLRTLRWAAFYFIVLGIALRFYRINQSDFVFYDEGYYLNFARPFGEILARHSLSGAQEILQAVWTFLRICLSTGKALWFFLVDSRMFWGGVQAWYFSRVMAAIFGTMTLLLVYPFTRRFYGSEKVALVAVLLFAILPSQVFYSRVGFQETLSAFLVLAGFYFYLFPQEFGRRTFVAGTIFGAAFFSNYRLIILPCLILVSEIWHSLSRGTGINFRKYLWVCLIFASCVFFIGGIDDGRNTRTVFSWMFHQAHMAETRFDLINLWSYPYYVFRLENILLGVLFFTGNIYLFSRRLWRELLPFVLVVTQMAIFSLAGEKGARYLSAVMPFITMSAAFIFAYLWRENLFRHARPLIVAFAAIMIVFMALKSFSIASIHSAYRQVTSDITRDDPRAKFLSTQPYVQGLFVRDPKNVESCPHSFSRLVDFYARGFRYLVIDPQAYISWTKDEVRFLPELDGYLGFMVKAIRPQRIYRNFNSVMLERFVFEHSENLRRSIEFLRRDPHNHYGFVFVYDLSQSIPQIMKFVAEAQGGSHGAR